MQKRDSAQKLDRMEASLLFCKEKSNSNSRHYFLKLRLKTY